MRGGGDTVNGYEFVDMGLSVKWCTCNIGATKPWEYGWYFQWAGTIAYGSDRKPINGSTAITFGWNSNCPYWKSGTSSSTVKFSKYVTSSSYGTVDNKKILDNTDDAACIHVGGNSRMPTYEEYWELYRACTVKYETNYNKSGIAGALFTLKSDSTKTLFFPDTRYFDGTKLSSIGTFYWAKSGYNTYGDTYDFSAASSGVWGDGSIDRYCGCPIRPVIPQ